MIPFHTMSILSQPGGSPTSAVSNCLDQLLTRLHDDGRTANHVLSLTFFVAAREADAYREMRRVVRRGVRDRFPEALPPVSVVGQPPEGERHAALEAAVLLERRADIQVERREQHGHTYSVVATEAGRQVHAAGLASSDAAADAAVRSREAFAAAQAVLDAEGLDFGHVVRQWNYLEEMLDVRNTHCGDSQGYQAFNDVRSVVYGRSTFATGYPAATGIGQQAGGVVIELVAVDPAPGVSVEPISNPKQVDAHRYSEDVLVGAPAEELESTTSPKFERGKSIATERAEVVFVSGTASILGEQTVSPGDVRAQTRTTIDNIQEVLGGRALTHLRAYVKRAQDMAAVRDVCQAAFGDIPSLYVQADVCRDDLLVELEGEAVAQRGDA